MPSIPRKYRVKFYSSPPRETKSYIVVARNWQGAIKYANAKLPKGKKWFLLETPKVIK